MTRVIEGKVEWYKEKEFDHNEPFHILSQWKIGDTFVAPLLCHNYAGKKVRVTIEVIDD